MTVGPTKAAARLGIDLGGTKIEIIALDGRGRQLLRRRVATPRNDYAATLKAIAGLVRHAERQIGKDFTLGIGTPGALSRVTGRLKNSNSTCLNGMPIREDLEHLLGRPLLMANDANCFTLSEARDGAARDAAVVFGVIVGTGCGGGIVVHGKVVTGPNAIAGEWGHNPLPWPDTGEQRGAACYCGRKGCIETYLSGPGMSRDHEERTGRRLRPETIVRRAVQGHGDCEATVARYEERMARALAHVINILDPDVIVLGGGMSNIDRLYKGVPRLWGRYVFSDRVDTRLVRARHGDSSGVRGAAWLW